MSWSGSVHKGIHGDEVRALAIEGVGLVCGDEKKGGTKGRTESWQVSQDGKRT